jgi:hypothetical protein
MRRLDRPPLRGADDISVTHDVCFQQDGDRLCLPEVTITRSRVDIQEADRSCSRTHSCVEEIARGSKLRTRQVGITEVGSMLVRRTYVVIGGGG